MSTSQLPLGLRFPPDQRLRSYRDAPPGLLELLAVLAGGDAADSVFLSGASGAGKSHLLLAMCAEAAAHGCPAAYLPLKLFAARAGEALVGQGAVPLACVDDVQSIVGDRVAEIALFDLHNRVRDAGGALLYAADATPLQLALVLPDLRSRLAQCTQFVLAVPDEASCRAILRERAQVRGLELDDAVLEWLFRRVDRDLATLTALLDRLDRESLAAQRRITVPFLRQILADDQDS
ncbi:MAG TPA: DnaA regulatory inactivator Hda [Xanthomonadaceae bacterium]|nr:DnaA regulatory inactivator Hda [Xanthomonadaceae bacterium]